MQRRELPDGWDAELPTFPADAKGVASRDSSGKVLNAIARHVPWLLGGAADLAPSTKTRLTFEGAGDFSAADPGGRNFHFGIREHAMGAILNGMSLSKVRPFGSGFLIFSDYCRPTIRLSALMEIPVIYIFTHDSIGVGEDGPTHQPVEHLASLRAIPGLLTIRPGRRQRGRRGVADDHAAAPRAGGARAAAARRCRRSTAAGTPPPSGVARGAYVLADAPGGKPEVLLIGTGSEVEPLRRGLRAARRRTACGPASSACRPGSCSSASPRTTATRCCRRPSRRGSRSSRRRRSAGAATSGRTARCIGMHTFGASAPLKELQKKFGFTPDHVLEAARAQLARARSS